MIFCADRRVFVKMDRRAARAGHNLCRFRRVERTLRVEWLIRRNRIVERLTESPGLRPEDVFINLVEVLPENWSFGLGEAQYVHRRGLFWGRVV